MKESETEKKKITVIWRDCGFTECESLYNLDEYGGSVCNQQTQASI